MKILRKSLGFTLLELIIALGLLGVVSVGTGAYISNSFKDSDKLTNSTEVQTAVTALMNKLETTIKTSDIPVLPETVNDDDFTITQIKNGSKLSIRFQHIEGKVNTYENGVLDTTYEYIEKITIKPIKENEVVVGANVEVVGEGEKYRLSSKYYTRNLITNDKANEIREAKVIELTYNGTQGSLGSLVDDTDEYQLQENESYGFLVITDKGATRYGYTLDGWEDPDKGIIYEVGDEIFLEENKILYAVWDPIVSTVTFDAASNGGKTENANSTTRDVTFDLTYKETEGGFPTAERTGYLFDGWYTETTGGDEITGDTKVQIIEPQTLYAQFTPITYKVKYDKNKPSNASSSVSGTTAESSHTYDSSANLTENGYSLKGWTFDGWNASADGSGKSYSDNESVKNLTTTNNATVTLYAQWEANTYTVKYDANKPSNATNNVTGSMPNSTHTYDTSSNLRTNTYSLVGWKFNGWNTKADGNGTSYTDKASISTLVTSGTTTLYAQWQAYTYTVKYDANKPTIASGSITGTTADSTHTYDTASNLRVNGYSLTGWTFNGWNAKADGTGTAYADKASVKNLTTTSGGTVTLYAQWKQNTYTVKYDANKPDEASNDVTGTMANSTHTYDSASNLRANGYSLTGWSFAGWNTKADGSGTPYTNKASISTLVASGSTTLYAQWTANTYTVKFDANGGTLVGNASITVTYDSTYGTLPSATAPAKTGYTGTFAGWYTAASGGNKITANSDVLITSAQTLYAHYSYTANKYTITYNKNKPSNASGSISGTTASSSHTYDAASKLTVNGYSLTGWTFDGWNANAAGTGTAYSDNASVKNLTSTNGGTVTLYAQWKQNTYTVIYAANKPDEASNNVTGTMANSTHTYDTASNLTANAYSLTGWTFAGWNTKADGSGTPYTNKASISTLVASGSTTLYAQWTANTYTVKFDANGGTLVGDASITVTYDSTYGDLPSATAPSKAGYTGTFNGWYTAASGGDKITASSTVKITKEQTLYAQYSYTANTYTVKFDANGGTLSGRESITVTYDSTYGTLPSATATEFGCTTMFSGWYTLPTGGIQVTSNKKVQITSNQTLYAHYTHTRIVPTLVANSSWYKGATDKGTITLVNILDSYTATGSEKESWNADIDDTGLIKCYITGTELTIVGNGAGKILANADSSELFRDFRATTKITGLDLIDTSNVTTMKWMFFDCYKLANLDISSFNTANVTTVQAMFNNCRSLTSLDVSKFNTSKVTDMSWMFYNCNGLTSLDVSKFDTSKVTDMSWMFYNCNGLTSLDVSKFDTSKVTNMNGMFIYCSGLKSLDVSKFNTSNVTSMGSMFDGCQSLTSLAISSFSTSKVTNMDSMFSGCSGLTSLDVSGFSTSNVTNMSRMFSGCKGVTSLDISKFNTSNVTTMDSMFSGCSGLTSLDITNFDTSNVTNMYSMFYNCNKLTSLDVSEFNTSKVTNMDGMFQSCNKLTSLDVSKFNTSNVTDMGGMFSGCSSLTSLDVTNFDTSNVTDMCYMFYWCGSLTSLDISNFNTSKVTDMLCMFSGCSNLVSLDVSNFNTSAVTRMGSMFYACNKLEKIVLGNNFNTSKVTDMSFMFDQCHNLTSLDLSRFDTSKVTSMSNMFSTAVRLQEIKVGEKFSFIGYTLPKPNSEYINGADGNWYTEDGTAYTVNEVVARHSGENRMVATYYAVEPLITVTYNANDGTGVIIDTQQVTKGSSVKLSESTFTRKGYVFQGWSTQRSGAPEYAAGATITPTDNMTLYAIWSPIMKPGGSWFDTTAVGGYGRDRFSELLILDNLDGKYYDESFPVDVAGNGDIMCYLDVSCDNVCIIVGNGSGKIYANPDSSHMFFDFNNVYTINGLDMLDTSLVTTMQGMFSGCDELYDLDLSSFNTSNVTNMEGMFSNVAGNVALSVLDLSSFDTSKVTNMKSMFDGAYTYSLDLSSFDTSNVTNMQSMFRWCSILQALDLSNFDTSKVTDMTDMFTRMDELEEVTLGAGFSFTGNGTASCTLPTPSNKYITGANGKWYTEDGIEYAPADVPSNVAATYSAIAPQPTLLPNHTWYKGSTEPITITKITFMDQYTPIGTETESWNANVANTGSIKCYVIGTELIISGNGSGKIYANADSSNFVSGWLGFSKLESISGLELFDTSKVTNMYAMFKGCSSLTSLDISNFDTSKVTSMMYMFSDCSSLTSLNLGNLDTSSITNSYEMYYKTYYIKEIKVGEKFVVIGAGSTDCTLPVTYSSHVPGADGKWYTEDGIGYTVAEIPSNVAATYYAINPVPTLSGSWYKGSTSKSSITKIKIVDQYTPTGSETESWNADSTGGVLIKCYIKGTELIIVGNGKGKIYLPEGSSAFWSGFSSVTSIEGLALLDTCNVTTMHEMFKGCSSLTNLDLSKFNTSKVTNMYGMFEECSSLTNLDLSKFNTSKVTNMQYMFYECSSLISLNISNFDTSNVLYMGSMFDGCSSLTSLDLSNFDTSNVTAMFWMFADCSSLTSLDLSNFDTSNVINMGYMFNECSSLTSLDLSNFDTSNVTAMNWMFESCSSLTSLDISGFDTTNVTNMSRMFADCSKITSLNVSSFNTGNVTAMGSMFNGCSSLTSIIGLNNFDTSNVTNMSSMFKKCSSLRILNLSSFNTSNVKYTNTTYSGMYNMFIGTGLDQVTLGVNFSLTGDGSTSCSIYSSSGYWYNSSGTQYTASTLPSNKAATYYATRP